MRFQYSVINLSLGLFALLSSSFTTVANATTFEQDTNKSLQSLASQNLSPQKDSLTQDSLTSDFSSWSKTQPFQLAQKTYRGGASWYGPGFHGRLTANGETFNSNHLTAAHRTLPFGTKLRVTNLDNGRSVVVRVNDRGPFIKGRIIDLSAAAARRIRMIDSGVASVTVEVID